MVFFNNRIKFFSKGFTLIELLIVVAILGVMAAAVLIAIDPITKTKAAKDATARSDMGQIANVLQSYYTDPTRLRYPLHNGSGIPGLQDLVTQGELDSLPNQQSPVLTCPAAPAGVSQGTNYCYVSNTAATGATAAFWGAMYSGAVGDYFCWDSTSAVLKKCAAAVATPTRGTGAVCNAACTAL